MHGLRRDRLDALLHPLGEFLSKVPDQQRNIFHAVAQGRDGYRKDLESVIQIATKPLFLDHPIKIAIGCGNDANIDAYRLGAPKAFKLLLLEHSKQLHLQFQRDFSHLVEEDRPAVGQFKPADLGGDRTGECAFFMSEEFAFQQPSRNRSAIDLDECSLPPIAVIVERPRDEFLPAPCFAQDQDCRIGRRHGLNLFEHQLESPAIPNDFLEVVGGLDLFFEIQLFLCQLVPQR